MSYKRRNRVARWLTRGNHSSLSGAGASLHLPAQFKAAYNTVYLIVTIESLGWNKCLKVGGFDILSMSYWIVAENSID